MDADMRRIEIEEVEDAKTKANNFGGIIRLEALDQHEGLPTYLNRGSHERELVEPVRTRTRTSMAA
ncbi:hypothetical protein JHK85_045701 [Glycine max]|nr:hypothetical protein JHK85_045701 [Glycine max]